jgi:hypothetical protein
MTDKKSDTEAARQRGPVAEPLVVGISPAVREQMDRLAVNPEIRRRSKNLFPARAEPNAGADADNSIADLLGGLAWLNASSR